MSTRDTPDPASLPVRVTELEIRFMQQERLLNELSDVLQSQQAIIDRLGRDLNALRSHVDQGIGDGGEPPPHY